MNIKLATNEIPKPPGFSLADYEQWLIKSHDFFFTTITGTIGDNQMVHRFETCARQDADGIVISSINCLCGSHHTARFQLSNLYIKPTARVNCKRCIKKYRGIL